jgi:protoporphyrinogen IX oxidase
MYLLFKALHLVFLVTWFSGLFYLPRLFIYHVAAKDQVSIERFKLMEWRLFYIILLPSSLLTTGFACSMLVLVPGLLQQPWIHLKLTVALILLGYQWSLWRMLGAFAKDKNCYSEKFFRVYNEVPSLFLIVGVIVAVFKPGG